MNRATLYFGHTNLELIISVFVSLMVGPIVLKLVYIVDQVEFSDFLRHLITLHWQQTFILVRYGLDTADLKQKASSSCPA